MSLRIAIVREVKPPHRGHPDDAGLDFFIPSFTDDFIKEISLKNHLSRVDVQNGSICLGAHERIMIPLGVKIDVPSGWAFVAFNKGGMATKHGVVKLAEVVDAGYQDEIFASVVNTGNHTIWLKAGEKLIQFLLLPIGQTDIEVISEHELFPNPSSRGTGKLGSTGAH